MKVTILRKTTASTAPGDHRQSGILKSAAARRSVASLTALAVYAALGGIAILLFRRIPVVALFSGGLFFPIPLLPVFLLLEKRLLKEKNLLFSLLFLYGIPFLPFFTLLLIFWNVPLRYAVLRLLIGSSIAAYLPLALLLLRLFYAVPAWLLQRFGGQPSSENDR